MLSAILNGEYRGAANDISKGSYNIVRVRQTFAGAYGIMTAAAYMKAGVLNARRSGRSTSLRGYVDPTDLSILSSVLGITQEVRDIEVMFAVLAIKAMSSRRSTAGVSCRRSMTRRCYIDS
jgi:hypothetical protein